MLNRENPLPLPSPSPSSRDSDGIDLIQPDAPLDLDACTVELNDEEMLRRVYDELRRIAAAKLALETPGQTLQPTALVHEALLRLTGRRISVSWQNERHFVAVAVQAMRHTLIDRARRKAMVKHGGKFRRVELFETSAEQDQAEQLVALSDALAELEQHDPQLAQFVNLRYFGGLGHSEAAAIMQISRRQADRHWALAKAWLYRRLVNQ